MLRLIFLPLIVIPFFIYAQPCSCAENFEFAYTKLKINYSGWQDKTSVDPAGFEEFTNQQRKKAKTETTESNCFWIISEWVNYFHDGHTSMYSNPSQNAEKKSDTEIRMLFEKEERINLSMTEVGEYFETNRDELSPIEGFWSLDNSLYTVAIMKNKTKYRDYAGIIMNADSVYWMPGQVKMEFKEQEGKYNGLFYMRDHSYRFVKGEAENDFLRMRGLGTWKRVNPESVNQTVLPAETLSNKIELQKLSANTLCLRLPTFNHVMKSRIDSLLERSHDLITETPNLIIDVRNNSGGSDVTYSALIKYLYTGPIKIVGSNIWSSEDNIQNFQDYANDPTFPSSSRKYFQRLVRELKKKPNSFYVRSGDVIRLKKKLPNPQKIAVLMNTYCASSCEQFILAAAFSDKVVLMGENTAGILDYGNVNTLSFPCKVWQLQYATSRTNRLPDFPIDNAGIEPKIRLGNDEDWIKVAAEALEGKRR